MPKLTKLVKRGENVNKKGTLVLRRAFALFIMSVVGFAMAALVASPATAQVDPVINFTLDKKFSEAEFHNTCEGTIVSFTSGSILTSYDWEVTVNGVAFGEFESPAPGETAKVFVPNFGGEIQVAFKADPLPPGWPEKHNWSPPLVDCENILEPEVVQPTCDDESGYIDIPEAPANLPHFIKPYVYKLNGVEVERGSTQEVGVGTHLIEVYKPGFKSWKEKLLLDWDIEIVKASDCPTQTASPSPTPTVPASPEPTQTVSPTPATGTGGGSDEGENLPLTGSPTQAFAIAGVGLLALGSSVVGLSVAWNRRRDRNAVDNLVADSAE